MEEAWTTVADNKPSKLCSASYSMKPLKILSDADLQEEPVVAIVVTVAHHLPPIRKRSIEKML